MGRLEMIALISEHIIISLYHVSTFLLVLFGATKGGVV